MKKLPMVTACVLGVMLISVAQETRAADQPPASADRWKPYVTDNGDGTFIINGMTIMGKPDFAINGSTVIGDTSVPIGTFVVTVPGAQFCETPEAVGNNPDLMSTLGEGCVVIDPGSEVQIVKKQEPGPYPFLCVAPRNQTTCRWTDPSNLETTDQWVHDSRNPNSDTVLNEKKQKRENCAKVVAILDHEPNVERAGSFDLLSPEYYLRLNPTDEISPITVFCNTPGPETASEMTVFYTKRNPSPEFLSFFGKLAHDVNDVDAKKAEDAVMQCYMDAKWNNVVEGKITHTRTLHVDCKVRSDGLLLNVFRTPPCTLLPAALCPSQ